MGHCAKRCHKEFKDTTIRVLQEHVIAGRDRGKADNKKCFTGETMLMEGAETKRG